jgi:hypothetical protein
LGLRGAGLQGTGGDGIMGSFMICTPKSSIIWAIKSGSMRWTVHVAHMGKMFLFVSSPVAPDVVCGFMQPCLFLVYAQ